MIRFTLKNKNEKNLTELMDESYVLQSYLRNAYVLN